MAPALQGICEGLVCLVGVQSCVRPVYAVMTAGPDGFRGRGPILLCGLRRPGHLRRVVLVPGPTGSPSLHMVLATSSRDTALIDKLVLRQLPSRAPASGRSRTTIMAQIARAASHGDGHKPRRLAGEQGVDARVGRAGVMLVASDEGGHAGDQKTPEVLIAHLGDPTEALLA